MSRHPLDPVFAKIERAKAHIKDLNIAVRGYLRSDPYRLVAKPNRSGKRDVWSIDPDPVPNNIECIAADAVHNLRTPLDKMLTATSDTVRRKGGVIGSIKFPTGNSRKGFECALCGQVEHLTGATIEFIETTQPYPGGRGELLYLVNKLDNLDKHRTLLTPVGIGHKEIHARMIRGHGFILSLGSRRGQHMVPVPDARPGKWDLHQPVEEKRPTLRLKPLTVNDYYLEFTGPENDFEVMTTTPGAKLQVDIKPALDVAFGDVEGFEREPIVNLLESMREAVETTLVAFRDRFF